MNNRSCSVSLVMEIKTRWGRKTASSLQSHQLTQRPMLELIQVSLLAKQQKLHGNLVLVHQSIYWHCFGGALCCPACMDSTVDPVQVSWNSSQRSVDEREGVYSLHLPTCSVLVRPSVLERSWIIAGKGSAVVARHNLWWDSPCGHLRWSQAPASPVFTAGEGGKS